MLCIPLIITSPSHDVTSSYIFYICMRHYFFIPEEDQSIWLKHREISLCALYTYLLPLLSSVNVLETFFFTCAACGRQLQAWWYCKWVYFLWLLEPLQNYQWSWDPAAKKDDVLWWLGVYWVENVCMWRKMLQWTWLVAQWCIYLLQIYGDSTQAGSTSICLQRETLVELWVCQYTGALVSLYFRPSKASWQLLFQLNTVAFWVSVWRGLASFVNDDTNLW